MLVHNFMEFKPKITSSLKGDQDIAHVCVTWKRNFQGNENFS